MRRMRRPLVALLAVVLLLALAAPAGAAIVVKGRFKAFSQATMTITYTSAKGTYRAKLIGTRHYRIAGRINGKRLRGSFRTRLVKGGRYAASGSGRLGSRRVRIGGGGPNTLKTSRLVLR
jgi:hypothetical protein